MRNLFLMITIIIQQNINPGGFRMKNDTTLIKLSQCFQSILPNNDIACKKLSPSNLLICLIFGILSNPRNMSLEEIRRKVMSIVNVKIVKSAFWERLTTKKIQNLLINLLYELMARLVCNVLQNRNFSSLLGVTDVWMIDSTIVTLWDSIKETFPGTFTYQGFPKKLKIIPSSDNIFSEGENVSATIK